MERVKLHRKSHWLKESRLLFLMPSLIGVFVFVLIPFGDMVRRSFQTAVQEKFCGLENYKMVLSNNAFSLAVKNTAKFVGVGIPLLILISLILSMALGNSKYTQQLKSGFLFPMAVPTAALVLIWKLFFHGNGIFNTALEDMGMKGIDWLGSSAAFWVLIISYIWKNTGYTIVLWLAGIKNISLELIEEAKVDGASGMQCFRYITLPSLKPTFYTITILSFLNSFKVFREAYLVAGAYPQKTMYLLQHLFNNWFTNLEIDKMSAAAVLVAIVFALAVMALGRFLNEEELNEKKGYRKKFFKKRK